MSAFEQYYVEVLRFLTRKLRDRDSAQDMTQETFSRALTLPSGGPVQSPPCLLVGGMAPVALAGGGT